MLTMTKMVPKQFPVTIETLQKFPPTSLINLHCSCCGNKLGNRPWGLAWTGKRGLRLCYNCMLKAELTAPVGGTPKAPENSHFEGTKNDLST